MLVASLLLGACRGSVPVASSEAPAAPPPPPAEIAPIADASLHGQLLLPPGTRLPPGARVRFTLLDRFPAEPDPLPLAQREQPLDGAPPLKFQVPYSRAAVRDPTVYRLDVSVFDAGGRLRFVSDGEHPVNLGKEAEPTRIELLAIDEVQRADAAYRCGELQFTAQFRDPDLVLHLPQGERHLRRAHAANGLRYIGHNSEFWLSGEQARLQVEAQSFQCREARNS